MIVLFFILAIIIVLSSIGVVAMRNPIHSALCLILNLLTVAAVFAMLEAHFLAMVQIIIYAGAIMVLVLFVIMLLSYKDEEATPAGYFMLCLAGICGVLFLIVIGDSFNNFVNGPMIFTPESVGSVRNIGMLLYTKFVFPFEAASILIMVAIVGATLLAKRHYKKREEV